MQKEVQLLDCPDDVIRWELPETEEHDLATFTIWRTACGHYAIGRVVSRYGGEHKFVAMYREEVELFHAGMDNRFWEAAGKPRAVQGYDYPIGKDSYGRPKNFSSLFRCMEAVLNYHRKKVGVVNVRVNDATIVTHAIDNKLAELPVPIIDNSHRSTPLVARNRFGSIEGSDSAMVDSVLSFEWKGMKQIQKEAEVTCTYYNHLNKLIAAKLVEKEKGKYRLTKN